jgi:citrate synthase
MTDKARIEIDGQTYETPVLVGSEGERGIDIRQLRAETGAVTYDPGYGNTAETQSAVTFIDGDEGILRYRGYPIEQLAEHSDFIETSYLLIRGKLPTREELDDFRRQIVLHTLLREDMRPFFDAFPRMRTRWPSSPPPRPRFPPSTRITTTRSTLKT